MKYVKFLLVVCALATMVCLTGCGGYNNPADIAAFEMPYDVQVNVDNYILQPPDEIQIISSKVPEIHEAIQQIRPDGKVTFEALGEFDVAGKTCGEVAAMVRKKSMSLYALAGDYPVDVRVAKFASKYYFIGGQVNFPGPRLVTGRDTVLSALSLAQPTVLAWTDRVKVIRPSYDPENVPPKIFLINLKKVVRDGDISKNVLLQEGDIVHVPPTVLAAIAMKIEEFVRPIGRAFSTVNIVQGP